MDAADTEVVIRPRGYAAPEAVRKLADLPRAKPSLNGLMSRARQLGNACNDAPGALRVYEQALKLYPDDANLHNEAAWFLLTTTDDKVRDAKRALLWAREAAKLSKEEDGNILDTLAKALHDTGQLEEAVRYAKRAAEKEPEQPDIVARAKEYAEERRTKSR